MSRLAARLARAERIATRRGIGGAVYCFIGCDTDGSELWRGAPFRVPAGVTLPDTFTLNLRPVNRGEQQPPQSRP